MVYNRTVTRFIVEVRLFISARGEMRLASDNGLRRRLKNLSWKSRRIILCTLEQRMAVSCQMSRADRCLTGLCSMSSGMSFAMSLGIGRRREYKSNCNEFDVYGNHMNTRSTASCRMIYWTPCVCFR